MYVTAGPKHLKHDSLWRFFFWFRFWMETAALENTNFVKLGFTTRPASHTLKDGLLGI
jgi:hypothetical protein